MEPAAPSPEISGLTAHSGLVEPGFLFAALAGRSDDGRRHMQEAVARGAVAVLAEPGAQVPASAVRVEDPSPRRRLAELAALLHGPLPSRLAAVTGTDGKTSVAYLARHLAARALPREIGYVGTLGLLCRGPEPQGELQGKPQEEPQEEGAGNAEAGPALTTPEPVLLARRLGGWRAAGVEEAVLEASSHGLDQERLSGLAPMRAACFTGLGRDHGDYHAGRGDYLAAKLRLFTERLADDGIAVLCAERDGSDEIARHLAAAKPGVRVLRYGGTAASGGEAGHRVASFAPEPGGASAEFVFQGPGAASGAPEQGALRCSLPFYAPFQAENLLAASLLASALAGRPAAELLAEAAANGVPQVPGRMERVLHSGLLSWRARRCWWISRIRPRPSRQASAASPRGATLWRRAASLSLCSGRGVSAMFPSASPWGALPPGRRMRSS